MAAHWTRADLPISGQVLGETTTEARYRTCMDTIDCAIAHLNDHFPKPAKPDPVDALAEEFETAARDALSATVNLLLTTFGVPVLDVDDLLDEIDWRQVARNHLGVSS